MTPAFTSCSSSFTPQPLRGYRGGVIPCFAYKKRRAWEKSWAGAAAAEKDTDALHSLGTGRNAALPAGQGKLRALSWPGPS